VETAALLRARPKRWYWLLYLLVMPIAGFIFTAIGLGLIALLLRLRMNPALIVPVWAVVTGAIVGWGYPRDRQRMFASLTGDALRLGIAEDVVIPFHEIESIVIGLPAKLPWWTFLMKANPGALRGLVLARDNTVVLRLINGRYLCLRFASTWIQGGRTLVLGLLEINREKVVGPETYTPEETTRLCMPPLHKVFGG
jgi:hypothetical protein